VNVTFCYSEFYPCVSAANANNVGVHTVAFTGRYLNVFRNSGARGFYRANDMGATGWYLWNSNFCNNSIMDGVLGSSSAGKGMIVDSCIFFWNTVDIGLLSATLGSATKLQQTNCVFSGSFPSSMFASSSACKSNTVTDSWAISFRLCPTDSASTPRVPFATQSTAFFASLHFLVPALVGRSALPISGSLHLALSYASGHSDPVRPGRAGFMMFSFAVAGLFEDSMLFGRSSVLDAPLSISPDGSTSPIGLMIGVPICVVAGLSGGIIVVVLFRRTVRMMAASDTSSQSDRSALHTDFVNDATDNPTVTTFAATVTDEPGSGIPMSVSGASLCDLTIPLLG
jgi:hypothetical protein